jgi:hypothetical protein
MWPPPPLDSCDGPVFWGLVMVIAPVALALLAGPVRELAAFVVSKKT